MTTLEWLWMLVLISVGEFPSLGPISKAFLPAGCVVFVSFVAV